MQRKNADSVGWARTMKYAIMMILLSLGLLSGCQKSKPEPAAEAPVEIKELVEGLPLSSHTSSPVSLLKREGNGTLLIKIKPHVYMDEMGCTMMSDDMGNTFSQMYQVAVPSYRQKFHLLKMIL